MSYKRRISQLLVKYPQYYSQAEAKSAFKISTSKFETVYHTFGNVLFVATLGMGYKLSGPFAEYVQEVIKKRQDRNFKEENPNQYIATKVLFTFAFMSAISVPIHPIILRISRAIARKK